MSIICQICQCSFPKIIPWQHLRLHNITSDEYKSQFGPLFSQDTLEKFKSRAPHNKGKKITDSVILEKFRESIKKREKRFQNGEFTRGSKKTAEQKRVHSIKQIEYARNNPDEMKLRTKKAIQTKITNGYDFGSPFRGHHHSAEVKEQSKQRITELNQKKQSLSHTQISSNISISNLLLKNDINDLILNLHCQTCGHDFSFTKQYFQPSKFKETICPNCYPRHISKSKGELEVFDYVKSLCPDAISGYRTHYHSKEIDIFVSSLNVGFEFNGLYWHSEPVLLHTNRSEKYDYFKQQEFNEQGIRVIQIFSDEWSEKQEIVKSRISSILKKISTTIYARKCSIAEISSREASMFCEKNHIMGRGRSNARFGLFYNSELVSVMTFTQNNISRKIHSWELNRFASKLDTNVVGGASRLFKAFLISVNPQKIITYADNRWSTGNLYKTLGFVKIHNGTPNYWYFIPNLTSRIHRYTLRKNKNDDQTLTEVENRTNQGYLRIWDSGSSKWEWSQK